MRTNITIDDDLMQQAMRLSGLSTKKEVVHSALEEYVQRRTRRDIAELRGKVRFADGYDHKAMRESNRHGVG
ncbi:MAG: type II toxin-antitoxin system VapB family antitoxin [Bacillota bacterium]|nr:type II toxin-antitoxin system VapB family antitoxin [Bacillota bacterium]